MNKVKNTFWNDRQLKRQRVISQSWPQIPSLAELWGVFVGTRADVRRRGGVIPAWVPLTAIMLAGALLCLSAAFRTRAALSQARLRYESEVQRVEQVRQANEALRTQLQRLKTDPAAVADAAHQYGMIRPNEKVVTLR